MASDLDVELEPYKEVLDNLDFSTPVGSGWTSPCWISTTSFQETIHQVEAISPVQLLIRGPTLWIFML